MDGETKRIIAAISLCLSVPIAARAEESHSISKTLRFDTVQSIAVTGLSLAPGSQFTGDPDSVDLAFDFGAIRDMWIESSAKRERPGLGALFTDVATVQLFDVFTQLMSTESMAPEIREGQGFRGIAKTVRWYDQHGLDGLSFAGGDWKDVNYGSYVNTIHGLPHFLNTSYFLARGHPPIVAAAAGMFSNVILHETLFEGWERRSWWDLTFNSLGVIFAAVPFLGYELTWSPATGAHGCNYYARFGEGYRFGITTEQTTDYMKLPLKDRPAMPNDIALQLTAPMKGARLGVTYRLKTNPEETANPLLAFDPLNRFEFLVSISLL